eukprot:Phypoly_transcript_02752.p1 GENE.Phypoly_transcript_02752~~Phypoly_transcript_02752.p1  ORF type:complete len:836 (+),score=42.07 Phypoly_transcript_02752:182-2689(+)
MLRAIQALRALGAPYAQFTKHPSCASATLLISSASRKNNMGTCMFIYEVLIARVKPDTGVFGALIHAALQTQAYNYADQIWHNMKINNIEPDKGCIGMLSLICARGTMAQLAHNILLQWQQGKFNNQITTQTCNNLIITFAKTSQLPLALNTIQHMAVMKIPLDYNSLVPLIQAKDNVAEKMKLITTTSNFQQHVPIIYNAIVMILLKHSNLSDTISTVHQMDEQNIPLDPVSLATLLHHCTQTQNMDIGWELHNRVLKNEALQKDCVVVTNLLRLLLTSGYSKVALSLWNQVGRKCRQDSFLFSQALAVIAEEGDISSGQAIHEQMVATVTNTQAWNALIRMYSKCGASAEAIKIWNHMANNKISPDAHTCAAVIVASCQQGNLLEGEAIYKYAFDHHLMSIIVQNAMLHLYGLHGTLAQSYLFFDSIMLRNVETYNTMLGIFRFHSCYEKAIQLYSSLKKQFKPTLQTVLAMIGICADSMNLLVGQKVHEDVVQLNLPLPLASLINMYSRCGDLKQAKDLFDTKKDSHVNTWTAMISAFGMHGQGKAAVSLLNEMMQHMIQPDAVTYGAVLNACSHAGLLDDAKRIMDIIPNHVLNDHHYVSMIDCLGRAGKLEEAEIWIHKMTKPSYLAWGTLLAACRTYKDINRAEHAASEIIKLKPTDAATYVLLANLYGSLHNSHKQQEVWQKMAADGIRKIPGLSTIVIHGVTHELTVDGWHPEIEAIHARLNKELSDARQHGYVPDLNCVLHPSYQEVEVKMEQLWRHSEKLALGLGLLATPANSPLFISKNLRVCVDCHTAIKHIAQQNNREIIVRDSNRFHHFSKNGKCSCQDYW